MNVIVLGDSVAVGCWDRDGGWVGRVRKELYGRVVGDDAPSYESEEYALVYNLSVSGETVTGTLDRFEDEVPPRLSDGQNVLVVAVGANDSYRVEGELNTPPGRFREAMKELLSRAEDVADDVLCVGLPPVDESKVDPVPWRTEISYLEDDRDRYASILAEVVQAHQIPYITPFEGIDDKEKELLLDDGVHLSTEGHEALAKAVLNALDALDE